MDIFQRGDLQLPGALKEWVNSWSGKRERPAPRRLAK